MINSRQTESIGLQLKDVTNQQSDELALLLAERSVVCEFGIEAEQVLTDVVIRDQDISPQQQHELGLYLGQREIERHPQAPQVPDVGDGVTLIWEQGRKDKVLSGRSHRVSYGGGQFG